MKKNWQKPEIEVLDVNMTMGGTNYTEFDATYNNNTAIPVNSSGQPLIGHS